MFTSLVMCHTKFIFMLEVLRWQKIFKNGSLLHKCIVLSLRSMETVQAHCNSSSTCHPRFMQDACMCASILYVEIHVLGVAFIVQRSLSTLYSNTLCLRQFFCWSPLRYAGGCINCKFMMQRGKVFQPNLLLACWDVVQTVMTIGWAGRHGQAC